MSIFRRTQRQRLPTTASEDVSQPMAVAVPDPLAVQAQAEDNATTRRRQEEQEAERWRQEAARQELAALNARVDSILSADSDAFLRNLEQPGGQ